MLQVSVRIEQNEYVSKFYSADTAHFNVGKLVGFISSYFQSSVIWNFAKKRKK